MSQEGKRGGCWVKVFRFLAQVRSSAAASKKKA